MVLNAKMDERIAKLTNALDKIFLKESTELSFVQGYSDCYLIVLHHFGETLYNSVKNVISEHLCDRVQPIVIENLCKNGLDVINKKWEDLDACVRKFHDILLFLDSNFAQPQSLLEVYDMGLYIFRNMIVRNDVISTTMQHVIFGMIISERQGENIDHSTIKIAINLLLNIGEQNNPFSEYDRIFEEKFLEMSRLFYKREAQNLLQNNNAIDYIKAFEDRLAEEKERISRYLHKRTECKIIQLVEDVVIKENLQEITHLDFGLNWMIQEHRVSELQKLYKLFKKYNQITDFNVITGQYFSANANSIVDFVGGDIDSQEKSTVIENLLVLKLKFDDLIKECFENNNDLKLIVNNMFTIAMTSKPKTSEYLACYVHEKMRKYEKNASDAQIDKELDEFIELFKLVTEKDVFERYYNNSLAKRLLSQRANLDIENKFIAKLQIECGSDYIKTLKNMTQDVTINETHMEVFHNEMIRTGANLPGIDFSINVLRSCYWPKFKQFPTVNLPKSMNSVYELYLKCYQDKHDGRKVTLQFNMGSTQIKACYEQHGNKKKREYIFEGTTLQAIILDLFNANDSLTLNEIQAKSNIPETSLDIVLNSLMKNKILKLEEKNEGLLKKYSVNLGFFSKNRRYKIKVINRIETSREENKNTDEQILAGRKLEIEAAIVRIMKTRKTLQEVVLQSEVIGILKTRFTPSVDDIKLKIKNLIQREYIAYATNDTKTILYID